MYLNTLQTCITVVCLTAMLSTIRAQADDDSEQYPRRDINGYTYTSPSRNPPRFSTWSEANSWCMSHSSTLPIVRNSSVQQDIQDFIQTDIQRKQPADNSIYLNAKKGSNNTEWRNVDGTISDLPITLFNTNVGLRAYVWWQSSEGFRADRIIASANYICQYPTSSTRCSSPEFTFGEYCFVKHRSTPHISWYSSRNKCVDNGGDLAVINETVNESYWRWVDTSQAVDSNYYWIGVRNNWWTWQHVSSESEGSADVAYTDWNIRIIRQEPSTHHNCICMNSTSDAAGTWHACDCDETHLIVCQSVSNLATKLSTQIVSTRTTRTATEFIGFMEQRATYFQAGLGIGLGIGFGVLLLLILLAIITGAIFYKKRYTIVKRSVTDSPAQPVVIYEPVTPATSHQARDGVDSHLYQGLVNVPSNDTNNGNTRQRSTEEGHYINVPQQNR